MKLHHIGIEVRDIEKSTNFYQSYCAADFLFELKWENETIRFFKLGALMLELVYNASPSNESTSYHLAWQVGSINYLMSQFPRSITSKIEGPYTFNNGWKSIFYQHSEIEMIEWIEIPSSTI
ncbi:VOC family protein [Alkalihalophilus lindianensis]|uniref:VOC family protein n=1 Tax=Alkalihalophilus lindianensis TaxID=1630542 RepID=A0ABU3XEM1_9BACI|nr:VOC family protein [Alkalihalophilus lindianensis]MDV2686336.1 VOC family protein [Alkalihalophilus lindianensis]